MGSLAVVIAGCGYAADFYVPCLLAYSELKIVGAYDADAERADAFTRFHRVPRLESLAETLGLDAVVANLTSIESHYGVTRSALLHGRHVFSEKPLALRLTQAEELQRLAEDRGLLLSSAPSTALGACYAAVDRALRDGLVGRPLVVYARLEDGPVYKMDYRNWVSASGSPWPARDELAAGPILEHAGYQLSWLVRLFGGVTEMTGTTTTVAPASPPPELAGVAFGPNLATWTLHHDSGVITQLSCGGLGPRDYSMRVVGDRGLLDVDDVMRLDSPVTYQSEEPPDGTDRIGYLGPARRLRYEHPPPAYRDTHFMDFAAGIAELAECVANGTGPRLGPALSLHVLELTLELVTPGARTVRPRTRYPGRLSPRR